ncbi:MAG: nucleotidyl transferase AbiEii/AbiGii toxin family protein [Thermoanaerobaculales bacterium]|nr:nucleotidyl transferase AbiEii/AbiGii toxin family protein [Thermoanaerobaculales bacterium]
MIPKDFITEWREEAPWATDEQVEQDLVISRAVAEIFRVQHLAGRLACRGGTAIFKLYLRPAARYSEDIDLVQTTAEPIGETFDALKAVLDPWLGEPRRVLKQGRVNLVYRYTSEGTPARIMKLKIEINSREHFTELGHISVPFEVASRWWSDSAKVTTFELDELLATKLRALYQRKKGRDLFDLWYALHRGAADPTRVIGCLQRYMLESGFGISRAVFEENLVKKLWDPVFRADMTPLLRAGIEWDIDRAGEAVQKALLARLPGEPWKGAENQS